MREDWIRDHLSFTDESVMSHESHLDFVKLSRENGYKPYLYYVCTSILTFAGEVTPDGFLDIVEESFDKVQPMWLYKNVMVSWDRNKIRAIQPR